MLKELTSTKDIDEEIKTLLQRRKALEDMPVQEKIEGIKEIKEMLESIKTSISDTTVNTKLDTLIKWTTDNPTIPTSMAIDPRVIILILVNILVGLATISAVVLKV